VSQFFAILCRLFYGPAPKLIHLCAAIIYDAVLTFTIVGYHYCDIIVGRGAGLVIGKIRNLGSTPDAVTRYCVLGKDT